MAAQTVHNRTAHNHSTDGSGQQDGQHGDTHQNGDSPNGSRQQNGERITSGWDQNPQLLQWRANVLLDEMMLGAVDITASEFTHAAPAQPRSARTASEPQPAEPYSDERPSGRSAVPVENPREPYTPDLRHEDEPPAIEVAHEDVMQPARDPQDEWARPAWHFAEPTASGPQLPPPPTATPAARAAILQEYTRAQTKPTDVAKNRPNGASARAVQPSPSTGSAAHNSADQWVLAAEQRYQKIATPPAAMPELNGNAGAASLSAASWVDPTDALFEDFPASSVASQSSARYRLNQAARRSNLLPRMTTLDPRALQQEMVVLQTEIEQALPTGHESRERALHLLQKAYALLQTDASRSAEVDYYLQQVRTIGQRVQETLHWSNLYHSRLRTYLLAWMVLSLIVIGSRYFYHAALVSTIARFSSGEAASGSLLAHNLLTIFAAFFAGALGGAIGAFINMHRYAYIQQGFFDRKYSLRGLILPLIGGVVSLVLCLIFGLVYYLFQVDPAVNVLLGTLPAVLAFGFGIAQEFIYGTRS